MKNVLTVVAMLGAAASHAWADRAPEPIRADPVLQDLIARINKPGRMDLETFESVLTLREATRHDPREMIRQTAFYAAQAVRPDVSPVDEMAGQTPEDVERVYALKRVMRRVEMDDSHVHKTLLPYLESEDQRLKRYLIDDVFGGWGTVAENDDHIRVLAQYVRDNRDPPPWAMIELMYLQAPSQAMQAMEGTYRARGKRDKASVEATRRDLYARHLIDISLFRIYRKYTNGEDEAIARREISMLARSPEWWCRLYAAEMMRRHDPLRDKELIRLLRKDENQLVRQAVDRPAPGED